MQEGKKLEDLRWGGFSSLPCLLFRVVFKTTCAHAHTACTLRTPAHRRTRHTTPYHGLLFIFT